MNKVFLLLISGAIVFTSFSGGYDFGRGKFQLQGQIYFDSTLLMDDTVYILPVDIFFKADSAEAELLYVNKNGTFDYTVNFVTPCLSGGTMRMCRHNQGLTEDACWNKLFRQCNYQFLEFSCRKKKFRYNLVPHAMEEYFYEKKIDFKNVTPKTFMQDILLE